MRTTRRSLITLPMAALALAGTALTAGPVHAATTTPAAKTDTSSRASGTDDTGLYNSGGFLYFYGGAHGGERILTANKYQQVVLTRNATTEVVTGFVDGRQQFTFVDSKGIAVIDTAAQLNLFRDNTVNGATTEAASGSVARVRIWNAPLTAAQVAGLTR
jgi:hypothetical protein